MIVALEWFVGAFIVFGEELAMATGGWFKCKSRWRSNSGRLVLVLQMGWLRSQHDDAAWGVVG
jgi:hypothetical protein